MPWWFFITEYVAALVDVKGQIGDDERAARTMQKYELIEKQAHAIDVELVDARRPLRRVGV